MDTIRITRSFMTGDQCIETTVELPLPPIVYTPGPMSSAQKDHLAKQESPAARTIREVIEVIDSMHK